jgi:hypothetical protein
LLSLSGALPSAICTDILEAEGCVVETVVTVGVTPGQEGRPAKAPKSTMQDDPTPGLIPSKTFWFVISHPRKSWEQDGTAALAGQGTEQGQFLPGYDSTTLKHLNQVPDLVRSLCKR